MPLLQWGKLRANNLPKVVEPRKVSAQAGLECGWKGLSVLSCSVGADSDGLSTSPVPSHVRAAADLDRAHTG